ncbi:Y-family DNA polymerase [Bifidobacterium choloepi]|uniref:Type VI secretion protein ImpB n=1 Tax=Bifidobacterium choloepi TaxID=2614131 RepID=A0A6I5MXW2_9BIFI|nr:type VI secretion protein ImpB [Bifidobacterium choloepi]NEG69428.1 type VI secretion protein ImpB [Bifidobacterium choloepi]
MAEPRTYLAIDLKSFYASAECASMGLDPLATNLVVADASRTDKTICLAVSPTLKAYGIAGRPRLFEVKRIMQQVNERRRLRAPGRRLSGNSVNAAQLAANPALEAGFVVAKPRMAYYLETSAKIYGIYLDYASADDIHVYSVDEVFIDVTHYLGYYGCTAHELARRIVADICAVTGITATAGIGTNLYLAKVAMDIVAKHIPADRDGVRIAELDETSYRRRLWSHRPLTDFWRVGRGTARKLEHAGLWTMGDIARCSLGAPGEAYNEDMLYRMFGVNAELLIDHAWGWEPVTIADIKAYRPSVRSHGDGQVLPRPYRFAEARNVACEMADRIALDLVEKQSTGDRVALAVHYDGSSLAPGLGGRGADGMPRGRGAYDGPLSYDRYGRPRPKGVHGSMDLGRFTSSARAIREATGSLFDRIVDPSLAVRRITVEICHVRGPGEGGYEQPGLFDESGAADDRQDIAVQRAVLDIKKKFGGNAVIKGMDLDEGATGIQRNNQIGGHAA